MTQREAWELMETAEAERRALARVLAEALQELATVEESKDPSTPSHSADSTTAEEPGSAGL